MLKAKISLEKVKKHLLRLLGDVSDQEGEEVEVNTPLRKGQRIVYAIGTVRVWKGNKYKKTGPNKWVRVFESSSKGREISAGRMKVQIKKAPDLASLVSLIATNKQRFLTPEGKMDPIVKQLIKLAKERRETVAPKAKAAFNAHIQDYKIGDKVMVYVGEGVREKKIEGTWVGYDKKDQSDGHRNIYINDKDGRQWAFRTKDVQRVKVMPAEAQEGHEEEKPDKLAGLVRGDKITVTKDTGKIINGTFSSMTEENGVRWIRITTSVGLIGLSEDRIKELKKVEEVNPKTIESPKPVTAPESKEGKKKDILEGFDWGDKIILTQDNGKIVKGVFQSIEINDGERWLRMRVEGGMLGLREDRIKDLRKETAPGPYKPTQGQETAKPEESKPIESPKAVPEPDAIEKQIDKAPKVIEKKVEPLASPKAIAKALGEATPENRNEVAAQVFGFDPPKEPPTPPEYKFTPKSVNVDKVDGMIPDFTPVLPINISLADPKTILTKPRPSYIPELNEEDFRRHSYKLTMVKLGENRYLIGDVHPQGFAVVSLDVLAATQHYYLTKAKAAYKVKLDEVKKQEIERYKKNIPVYEESVAKAKDEGRHAYDEGYLKMMKKVVAGKAEPKVRIYEKAPRMLGDNRMTHVQAALLRSLGGGNNLNAFTKKPGEKDTWGLYRELNEEMTQKMGDMKIQYEDMLNTHAKGEETSYGKKGASKALVDELGVLVKRQNGKEIKPAEVAQVKEALQQVFGVFGDRSEMAKKYGLLISHAGEVRMHARKAVGLFHPSYHAIGVSFSDQGGGFTLAHEYAHFMDNYMGGKGGYHYASDRMGSDTHEIASTFRKNMAKAQKSDYQNRTCECFARALEQYFATKTGTGDTYIAQRNTGGNHPNQDVFDQKVAPLIEAWFKKNDALLKSAQIALVIRVGKR